MTVTMASSAGVRGAPPALQVTAGTRRIATDVVPICRVPPICDPRRDRRRTAVAGVAP